MLLRMIDVSVLNHSFLLSVVSYFHNVSFLGHAMQRVKPGRRSGLSGSPVHPDVFC